MADMTVGSASSGVQSIVEKSGSLVRGLGFWAVMAFGVGAISLSWAGQAIFSTVAGMWPGANLAIILLLAMVLSLFHAYTYAIIGAAAPRSGADYHLASRVLSKPLGFASSWLMVLFSGFVGGSLIASIPQSTLPMIFNTLALITRQEQFTVMAGAVASPDNIIIIGTVLVVVAFLSLIFSQRFLIRLLQVGAVFGLLAWAIIYFQLASVPAGSFAGAWNSVMGPGDYLDRIIQARAYGMDYSFDLRSTWLAGLVLGAWIFNGYFIPTFFAGEVKKPQKTLLWGSLGALLLTFAIFTGAVLLVMRLAPSEWLAAESYLYLNPEYQDLSMPWVTFYAAVVRPIVPLIWIVSIAWVFTLFNLGQTFLFYTSRIILAWAEDRMLPGVVSYVHPTSHSPLLAILIAAFLAELGVVDASFNGQLTSQLNYVIFVVVAQFIPVLAVTLMPFLKREWFESTSPIVRAKLGPVPVITVVGMITLAYMAWLVVANFIFPVNGGVSFNTWLVLGGVIISGLVWYFGRASFLKDQSVSEGSPAS